MILSVNPRIELLNEDNMTAMARYPDKHFDLAIVDPPFFKGVGDINFYGNDFTNQGRRKGNYKPIKGWDSGIPTVEYYNELTRTSKHQIIWGINYYSFIPNTTGRIIWDKKNDDSTFSNCEIASCSLTKHVKIFRYLWNGMLQENMKHKEVRIHPTHKPIALYTWLLSNYAKQGDKILDTHLGSGSSAIAAYQMGFDFTGMEIDLDYYEASIKRFKLVTSQTTLFNKAI